MSPFSITLCLASELARGGAARKPRASSRAKRKADGSRRQAGMLTELRLHYAHRRFGRHNTGEAHAGLAQKFGVFFFRALSAAGADEHHQVEHLARVWRVAL